MKPTPLAFLAIIAFTAPVQSQDENLTIPTESASPTAARILGEIPDGTPPPPEPPKPEFRIPKRDILDTATHEQGGRTVTIRQIKPIALPPPPPPVEPLSPEASAAFRERVAEYREEHPKSGLLFLSATVFRSKDSPPRTLVRYWPEGGLEDITFWSSADFALIVGGINSFVDAAANTHYLLMGWGNVDIDRMSELQAAKGRQYDAPVMPEFTEGKASFQMVGKQPAAEDIVPIQALHDLYNSEHARLLTAFDGREKARTDHETYLKANPPRPKDITLNYWRIEKPATHAKGGAAR